MFSLKNFSFALILLVFLANIAFAKSIGFQKCDTDILKKLALRVVDSNIVDCKIQKNKKCFQAGGFWHQFWVRDTSYSSLMGLWKLHTEELKNTFKELVLMNGNKGYPIQDPSSDFGVFPYQTDSVIWMIGAFELAKQTNDAEFRKYVYGVGKKIKIRWKSAQDFKDGLLFGAPSFLDSWASIPKEWQKNRKLFLKNKFLSTNVLWLRFLQIMLWEGKNYEHLSDEAFSKNADKWQKELEVLNVKFYNQQKGYYNYYIGSDMYEALGNGLMRKFNFNFYPIKNLKTKENFYPASFPMFDFKISGNWYSDTVQHTWVDSFMAAIDKEPLQEFCSKYFSIYTKGNDTGELIQDGKMFGGDKQLWSAVGLYFYLETINNSNK